MVCITTLVLKIHQHLRHSATNFKLMFRDISPFNIRHVYRWIVCFLSQQVGVVWLYATVPPWFALCWCRPK